MADVVAKIVVTVNGVLLQDFNLRPRVESAMRRAGIEAESLLRSSPLVPRDTGALRLSMARTEPTPTPDGGLSLRVGSSLPYSIVMDQGRRPGQPWPPSKPIEQWIIRKGLLGQTLTEKRFKLGKEIQRLRSLKSPKKRGKWERFRKLQLRRLEQTEKGLRKFQRVRGAGGLATALRKSLSSAAKRKTRFAQLKAREAAAVAVRELNRLSFAIRGKIAKKGSPGIGGMFPTRFFDAIAKVIQPRFSTLLAEELRR